MVKPKLKNLKVIKSSVAQLFDFCMFWAFQSHRDISSFSHKICCEVLQ